MFGKIQRKDTAIIINLKQDEPFYAGTYLSHTPIDGTTKIRIKYQRLDVLVVVTS